MNRKFKSIASSVAVALALTTTSVSADEQLDVGVNLNTDTFFGFTPIISAAYHADSGIDYTFYGIQWTGVGSGASGFGHWTEFGGGVAFSAMDGALSINPQIGITSGTLLSGSDTSIVGEGIVPNLTVGYDDADFEAELYVGAYLTLRDEGANNEYLHYWVHGGKKFTKYFSAGVHFEELSQQTSAGESVSVTNYQWLGAYFQVAKDNAGIRFTAGADMENDDTDFYKLAVFYNF